MVSSVCGGNQVRSTKTSLSCLQSSMVVGVSCLGLHECCRPEMGTNTSKCIINVLCGKMYLNTNTKYCVVKVFKYKYSIFLSFIIFCAVMVKSCGVLSAIHLDLGCTHTRGFDPCLSAIDPQSPVHFTSVHCKKEKVSSTQIFKATDCTEFLSWRYQLNFLSFEELQLLSCVSQVFQVLTTKFFKFWQLSFSSSDN